ncbi:MAG TPA: hypothetical protein VGA67_01185 [Candidatus Dojkabacteria bacterium]
MKSHNGTLKFYAGELSFENDSFETYNFVAMLSEQNIDFIRSMQEEVKRLGDYELTFFHDCLEVYEETESEFRKEVFYDFNIVHVQKNFIRITGVLKYDYCTFSTGIFKLEDMEENNS